MPRFAANLTMLFNELPMLERFGAAARNGFAGVEMLFPYAFDCDALAEQLRVHALQLVLHNLPAGDWDAGERGIACLPDRVDEFRAGIDTALHYAQVLGVKQLNCLCGIAPAGVDPALVERTLVANLRYAASRLQQVGLRLLIEPINQFDIPGFWLSRTAQAAALIAEVGVDNLFIQYDVYHAQRTEGELAATLQRYLPAIRHIQIADNPGRGEPGSGEINYPFLFAHLDRIGYDGWVGCEYRPRAGTESGLRWRATLGR